MVIAKSYHEEEIIKKSWNQKLTDYKKSNKNIIEQKMFSALSAVKVLNHVAKAMQSDSHRYNGFRYDKLKKAYKSASKIYDLKNELLRFLYTHYPKYVKLSAYIPTGDYAINVIMCDKHYDDFRKDRSRFGTTPAEFYEKNKKKIDQCQKCIDSNNTDHYNLYYVKVKLPRVKNGFKIHYPYSKNESCFPKLDSLPKAKKKPPKRGMFRFGQEAQLSELQLALAVDLTKPIKDFLQENA